MTLHGIDLSHYQAGISLAKTDAQFALFKATEGRTYNDPQCANFVQQARSANLPWGLYHFASNDGHLSAEADHFLTRVRQLNAIGEAVLVLDWEAGNLGNVSGAKGWLDRVYDAAGVRPLIYMSQSVATGHNWSAVATRYPLWVARYNDEIGSTGAWAIPTMWQYTDAHPTAGWTVDANRFYGDTNLWRSIAAGDTNEEDNMPLNQDDKKWIKNTIDNAVDEAFKRRRDPNGDGEKIRQFDLNAQLNVDDPNSTDTVRNRLRGSWEPGDTDQEDG